ncbi:MAG: zinc ABC transporter substrate-binding protein [Hyphomicrobium sp.]
MKLKKYLLNSLKKYQAGYNILACILINASSSYVSAQDLKIIATIKPIHSLVSMVVGKQSLDSPTLLIKGATSPHSYGLNPSDAKILNSAKIIFRVSNNIEPFLAKVLYSLPTTIKIVTLSETPGLRLLRFRSEEPFEREHNGLGLSGHHYEQKQTNLSNLKNLSQIDGHIWLDPENAILLIKEINRVLNEFSPNNAKIYEANAAQAISDIQKTNIYILDILKPLRGKSYIVFHDALFYFENHFNFPSMGSITISPEIQSSAKHIAQIRDKIKTSKVNCVFKEPNSNTKILDTILEGSSTKVGDLDPEGLLVTPGPSAYSDILVGIALGLQTCLM